MITPHTDIGLSSVDRDKKIIFIPILLNYLTFNKIEITSLKLNNRNDNEILEINLYDNRFNLIDNDKMTFVSNGIRVKQMFLGVNFRNDIEDKQYQSSFNYCVRLDDKKEFEWSYSVKIVVKNNQLSEGTSIIKGSSNRWVLINCILVFGIIASLVFWGFKIKDTYNTSIIPFSIISSIGSFFMAFFFLNVYTWKEFLSALNIVSTSNKVNFPELYLERETFNLFRNGKSTVVIALFGILTLIYMYLNFPLELPIKSLGRGSDVVSYYFKRGEVYEKISSRYIFAYDYQHINLVVDFHNSDPTDDIIIGEIKKGNFNLINNFSKLIYKYKCPQNNMSFDTINCQQMFHNRNKIGDSVFAFLATNKSQVIKYDYHNKRIEEVKGECFEADVMLAELRKAYEPKDKVLEYKIVDNKKEPSFSKIYDNCKQKGDITIEQISLIINELTRDSISEFESERYKKMLFQSYLFLKILNDDKIATFNDDVIDRLYTVYESAFASWKQQKNIVNATFYQFNISEPKINTLFLLNLAVVNNMMKETIPAGLNSLLEQSIIVNSNGKETSFGGSIFLSNLFKICCENEYKLENLGSLFESKTFRIYWVYLLTDNCKLKKDLNITLSSENLKYLIKCYPENTCKDEFLNSK